MKLKVICVVILQALLVTNLVFAWSARIVGVSDGDTVTALREGNEQVKIRLYGIDAPESSQPHGRASKNNLSDLVFGKSVNIEVVDTDRYGRTVARIIIGDTDVNAEQIKAGYAWVYNQYCTKPLCTQWIEFQKSAQNARLGLWADKSPIPPWDWRRGNKADSETNQVQSVGSFHGNVRSLVFHASGCKHFNCQNCIQKFSTRAEAISQGFKPCGICKP